MKKTIFLVLVLSVVTFLAVTHKLPFMKKTHKYPQLPDQEMLPKVNTDGMDKNVLSAIQKKSDRRIKLRERIMKELNKTGDFDAISGRITSEIRAVDGRKVKHMFLTTADGDVYFIPGLVASGTGENLIILGSVSPIHKGYSLKTDEIAFLPKEVYTRTVEEK